LKPQYTAIPWLNKDQFQKIFVLSMPNRSDKRDAIALSAYVSGLQVEFIDGVDPASMSPKAYPAVNFLS
jgi:hypothetical protein